MEGPVLREFLVDRVRPAILDHYTPKSCIPTVRVVLEICRYFGVHARPWPCEVLAMNEWAARLLLEEGTLSAEEIAELNAAGAAAVGIADHLVVLATFEDGEYLIDLTLDQARRAAWGIHLGVIVVNVTNASPIPGPLYSWVNDAMVRWTGKETTEWREMKDWRTDKTSAPIAGALIRELRAKVGVDL